MNIQRLILYTHALEAMKGFYSETLGLRLIMDRPLAFAVQIGGTMVEFHAWEQVCRYHFAINVPPGSIEAAHDWLAARTPILLRDGDHIVEFPNWKARAVYFHDPAGNIVELIAREEFDFHLDGEFGRDHLASISEIGLPAYDLEGSLKRVLEEDVGAGVLAVRGGFCGGGAMSRGCCSSCQLIVGNGCRRVRSRRLRLVSFG